MFLHIGIVAGSWICAVAEALLACFDHGNVVFYVALAKFCQMITMFSILLVLWKLGTRKPQSKSQSSTEITQGNREDGQSINDVEDHEVKSRSSVMVQMLIETVQEVGLKEFEERLSLLTDDNDLKICVQFLKENRYSCKVKPNTSL